MKNYRVSATKSGFVIELNTAVSPSHPNIDPENPIMDFGCMVLFIRSVENIQFLKALGNILIFKHILLYL